MGDRAGKWQRKTSQVENLSQEKLFAQCEINTCCKRSAVNENHDTRI